MMPENFKELLYEHVKNYISNNNVIVKDKEVFFINGDGHIVFYEINGSVLLNLKEEFYIFTQLKCREAYFVFPRCCIHIFTIGELFSFNIALYRAFISDPLYLDDSHVLIDFVAGK